MSISGVTSVNQCYIPGKVFSDGYSGSITGGTIGTSIGVMFCDTDAYYE
jgi:hypothetical protein